MRYRLLGFDTGLTAFGMSCLFVEDGKPKVEWTRVFTTKPTDKKRRLRQADDLGQRIRYLAKESLVLVHQVMHERSTVPLAAFCVEATALPMGKTKLSTVAVLGRARGIVDVLAEVAGVPILEFFPAELKKLAGLSGAVSKAQLQTAVEKRCPSAKGCWPSQVRLVEHAADATATALLGMDADLVRALVSLQSTALR